MNITDEQQRYSNQFRKCPIYDFQISTCNSCVKKNANSKSNEHTKIENKTVSSVLRHNRSNSDFSDQLQKEAPWGRGCSEIHAEIRGNGTSLTWPRK